MSDRLQRLIQLINKTGDKLIVFDSYQSDNCYVISSLKDYERLIKDTGGVKGLTEDELIDKINRDIAVWKSDQAEGLEFSGLSDDYATESTPVESSEPVGSEGWNPPKPSAPTDSTETKNMWKIPESRRREAEFNL